MIRSYQGSPNHLRLSCYVDDSAQSDRRRNAGRERQRLDERRVAGRRALHPRGRNSNIQDCSVLHGMLNQWPVIVGDWVTVGHSVTLHGCVVEDRCLIGMGVVILNGARIGAGSIVAAGTLIPEGTRHRTCARW